MSRVEHIGDATLYCGDALEIAPTLTGIDACISDPPYGISYQHGARRGGIKMGTDGMHILGDDVPFDPSPFLHFPVVLLWGAEHFKERLPSGGRWLVWDKRRPGVVRDQGCVENAWCSERGVTRIFRHVWDGADMQTERGDPRVHSNQKPVALMEWCLQFAPEANTVLDPYMGSASTAIACLRRGVRFIGIELDPTHYETALRRIEAEHRRPRLALPEPPPRPTQEALL